jgi:hypothetical protein
MCRVSIHFSSLVAAIKGPLEPLIFDCHCHASSVLVGPGQVRSGRVAQVKDQTRYKRLLGRYRLAAFGRYFMD